MKNIAPNPLRTVSGPTARSQPLCGGSAPLLAYNHFVEALFVLNGCQAGLHAGRIGGGGGSSQPQPSQQQHQPGMEAG
eukprot:scaffold241121_cov21-Tisochrysis_lutea.AAC.1